MRARPMPEERGGNTSMKVNVTRCRRRGLLALLVAVFASDAMSNEPVPLAISNPGFEADAVSEGCFEVLFPTAWPVYDPNGILNGGGNSVGGLNLPPGSVFFPAGAPPTHRKPFDL